MGIVFVMSALFFCVSLCGMERDDLFPSSRYDQSYWHHRDWDDGNDTSNYDASIWFDDLDNYIDEAGSVIEEEKKGSISEIERDIKVSKYLSKIPPLRLVTILKSSHAHPVLQCLAAHSLVNVHIPRFYAEEDSDPGKYVGPETFILQKERWGHGIELLQTKLGEFSAARLRDLYKCAVAPRYTKDKQKVLVEDQNESLSNEQSRLIFDANNNAVFVLNFTNGISGSCSYSEQRGMEVLGKFDRPTQLVGASPNRQFLLFMQQMEKKDEKRILNYNTSSSAITSGVVCPTYVAVTVDDEGLLKVLHSEKNKNGVAIAFLKKVVSDSEGRVIIGSADNFIASIGPRDTVGIGKNTSLDVYRFFISSPLLQKSFEDQQAINDVSLDCDNFLLSVGYNPEIALYDVGEERLIATKKYGRELMHGALNINNHIFATGDSDPNGSVRLWDIRMLEPVGIVSANDEKIYSIDLSPYNYLCGMTTKKGVRIVDLRKYESLREPVGFDVEMNIDLESPGQSNVEMANKLVRLIGKSNVGL